jgi:hypothetical protein
MSLAPLVLVLALGACKEEAPPPEAAPAPPVVEEPSWKTVVIYDPDGDPTFRSHTQDIARAGARLGVYVTVFPGPDGAKVPVLGDPQGDGTPEVLHMLDLSTVTTSRTGWFLAENGKTPLFQEPGSRSQFAAAATRYFGQDFVQALPWRVVIGIDRTPEATFELHLDLIGKVVADADVYVLPWRKNDPTPVRFPPEGEAFHTLDPTTMTQAQTGWIFAEEGRTPMVQPPAKLDEVMKAVARYFRVGVRGGGVGLALRPDDAAGLRGGRRKGMRTGVRTVRRGPGREGGTPAVPAGD